MKKNVDMSQAEFDNLVDELDSQGKIDKLKGRYALLVDHKIVKWDDDLDNIVQEFQKRGGKDIQSASIQDHGDGDGAKFFKSVFKLANQVINDKDDDDAPIKSEIKPGAQYSLLVNHKIVKEIDDYNQIKGDFLNGAHGLEEGDTITLVNFKARLAALMNKDVNMEKEL